MSLSDILQCLNDTHRRATYGAVAGVLGVPPRSLGAMLGNRRPDVSWVVNGETGLPTDYEQTDWHPNLLTSNQVIRTSNELALHLTLWRKTRPMSN
jgi:alkylated DNA nucleotide flippase Atl1